MSPLREPLWYKDAIFYELHVKAFFDSNADGVGDFPGLTAKLDYLQWLGINCIWLLPFYPSPFKDDGYDISDYRNIHSGFGTVQDFRTFLDEAHRRGIRVIVDLIVNHTSDQHAWFQEARLSPLSPKRQYYVWSDTDQRYRKAGSSLSTLKSRTGRGTLRPRPIIGIASSVTSRISITTILRSGRPCST